MMPVRRDLRFNLTAGTCLRLALQGSHVTHFFNALSLLFPAGERFFMDSVRNYRDQIDDPVLKKQVLGFIGQEAMHTREHIEYNDLLQEAGLPAHKLDDGCGRSSTSAARCSAFVSAHGRGLPRALHGDAGRPAAGRRTRVGGSVQGYAQMWTWHALEETEHKAVSFDVWNTVLKPGLGALSAAHRHHAGHNADVLADRVRLPRASADRRSQTRRPYARHVARRQISVRPRHGVFPRIAGEWLSFFRPGFHPWDHDNRAQLARIDGLVAAVDSTNAATPAAQGRRRGVQAAA